MTQAIIKNREHYDNISKAWLYLMGECFHWGYFDDVSDQDLGRATERLVTRMASRMNLKAGQNILDVGCGIGGPALQLCQQFDVSVTGISISEQGVAIAKKNAEASGHSLKADFHLRDAMENGFIDEQFDHVWLMEMSHLLPDKCALIKESCRVLKKGGTLALCDLTFRREPSLSEMAKMRVELRAMERAFGVARLNKPDFYKEIFLRNRLEPFFVEDISDQVSATADQWIKNAEKYRLEVVELIGESALSDFVISCKALRKLYDDKIWGYHIFWVEKS